MAGLIVDPLPSTNPESALWDRAEPLSVPLSGQLVVRPTLSNPSVSSLEVRSLYNRSHIAFRLSWQDPVVNNRTTLQKQFRDAVAIQVGSASQLPFLCMGSSTARMHIMQWKADWQADIEDGFHDLQDAFPNFWVDYYPLAVGEPPYVVPDAFPEEASRYLVGYDVGNPFSQPLKVTPVEDAISEGFSTVTTQRNQSALGWGVWSDGAWSVVIARPKVSGDSEDTPIEDGNVLAFAVWDGEAGNVGSRKSVSTWVTLRLQIREPADLLPRVVVSAIVLVAAAALIVLFWRRRGRPVRLAPEEP